MRSIVIILFVCIALPVFSQDDVEVTAARKSKTDTLRAQYIQTFPDHFFLWPVLKQRRLDFEMESLHDRKDALTYKSNKPFGFGVGAYILELGFELVFSIPVDEKDKALYGESDASDIQLNILGKKFGIDAFYQKYNGFYIDDPAVPVPANTPYPQRADIRTKNIGVTGNYVFNHRKFSYRSAYNFAERQIRSAGSFVLYGSVNSFKAEGDSAILGESYATRFGEDSHIRTISTTTLSVAPGYTYNFVYKGFFINGLLALGPANNWIAYQTETGDRTKDVRLSAFIAARLAMGYNGDRFFGGLSFVSQNRTARFDSIQLTSSSGTFRILVGYRFRETGFLKKRIWDIPKELF